MKRLIVITTVIVFFSCDFKTIDAPYGTAFNVQRKKVGLRIIDSTFRPKKILSKDYKKSPIVRKIKNIPAFWGELKNPAYVGKKIYLNENTGDILYEEDVYISGVNKAGVDYNIVESLTLRYVFKTLDYSFQRPPELGGNIEESYQKGWEYIHEYPAPFSATSNYSDTVFYQKEVKKITEQKADSLLISWQLTHL